LQWCFHTGGIHHIRGCHSKTDPRLARKNRHMRGKAAMVSSLVVEARRWPATARGWPSALLRQRCRIWPSRCGLQS
jgi:hypothetical protein